MRIPAREVQAQVTHLGDDVNRPIRLCIGNTYVRMDRAEAIQLATDLADAADPQASTPPGGV